MAKLNIAYAPTYTQVNTYQDNPRELGVWAIYDLLAERGTDFDTLIAADLLPYVGVIHTNPRRLLRDLRNRHRAKTQPKPKRKSTRGKRDFVRTMQLVEVA